MEMTARAAGTLSLFFFGIACSSDPSANPPATSQVADTTDAASSGSGGAGAGIASAGSDTPNGAMAGTGGAGGEGGRVVVGVDAMAGSGGSAGTGAGEAGANPPPAKSFLCNLLIGTSVQHDWFGSGFEAGVDDSRWEALAPAQARISFIQTWADPNSSLWTMAKMSPCQANAENPDRVIFVGVNWEYTTAAQWVTQLEAVVGVLEAKFTNLREIDLMTMLRAPGNVSCGSVETVVQPFVDEAIQTVATNHPALIRISPKTYAPSCDVFTGGGPHFTADGMKTVAKLYSDYYAAEP